MEFGRKKNKKAIALAEAIMATVVLGIAAAGVLMPFTSAASTQAEGNIRTLAAKLASDMLENIVNSPFDQIVTTYNGYTETQGNIKDSSGNVFTDANYSHFSRSVTCQYVYLPQESGNAQPGVILVTVTVSYNGKITAVIKRFVGR